MTRQDYMEKIKDIQIGHSALLYFPKEEKLVFFDSFGGDQLLPIDIEQGYNDYIDITTWDIGWKEISDGDGGLYIFDNTKVEAEHYNLKYLMYDAILNEVFSDICPDFMVLESE